MHIFCFGSIQLLVVFYIGDLPAFVFCISLIKMVYSIAAKSGERPRWYQLEHAIKRNFGGLIEGEPVEIFKRYYQETDVSRPFVLEITRSIFKK